MSTPRSISNLCSTRSDKGHERGGRKTPKKRSRASLRGSVLPFFRKFFRVLRKFPPHIPYFTIFSRILLTTALRFAIIFVIKNYDNPAETEAGEPYGAEHTQCGSFSMGISS